MTKSIRNIIIIVVILIVVIILRPFFILPEGEQAVVTRFGRITKIHTEAGLKVRMPAGIDKVTRYSSKILSWDGEAQRLPTSEQQYIWVDTTARWRIVDAEIFYTRVINVDEAYSRLDNAIESAVKTAVSQYTLTESVRSTNAILESETVRTEMASLFEPGEEPVADEEEDELAELFTNAFISIETGREELSEDILIRARASMPEFGIEIVDLVIRQIRYSEELNQSVYDRMISERYNVASRIRSEGLGKKAEIMGDLNRDRELIQSEARAKAAEIKAEGDSEAARIYADAYNADPEFYSFWKALETYQQVLPGQDKILSTDMDFFKYLYEAD